MQNTSQMKFPDADPLWIARRKNNQMIQWRSDEMDSRYYIVEDDDGWQVIDGWTNLIAMVVGRTLRGLTFSKADDLARLLTYEEQTRAVAHHLQSMAISSPSSLALGSVLSEVIAEEAAWVSADRLLRRQ